MNVKHALLMSTLLSQPIMAATYSVVELPSKELAPDTFAVKINDQGQVLSTLYTPFNLPIDTRLLDFENAAYTDNLTDATAAQLGNFNADDYAYTLSLVLSNSAANNVFGQRLGDRFSLLETANESAFLYVFDRFDETLDSYTFSNDVLATDISESGIIVGHAEGATQTYTYVSEAEDTLGNEVTYSLPAFYQRGFVLINGSQVELPPIDLTGGGYSVAVAINENLQVVGMSTENPSQDLLDSIAECESDDVTVRGDQPVETCLFSLFLSGSLATSTESKAVIWQLDESGNIVSTQVLPLAFTPDETEETIRYDAEAADINNAGIAVGRSHTTYQDTPIKVSEAVIYQNGQTIPFIDKDSYFPSKAKAINNNNIIAGELSVKVNDIAKTKFFVYDMSTEELVIPDLFFNSAQSAVNDINDNNLLVGNAEVETQTTSTRRRHGILYDIAAQSFQNLNDLLPCDSPYTIIDAVSINNNNQIVANAIISDYEYDFVGEVVVDEDGNQVTGERVIAVRLDPIDGVIETCATNDNVDQVYQRQGASWSWFAMLCLLVFARLRRQHKI